jgi:hypothetical protein
MPHQDQIRIFWCISFASAQWHQNFTLLNTAWIEWIIFCDFLSIFGHFWSLFGNVTPPESQLEPLKMAVTSCFWWLSSQPPVTHDEHLIEILQYLENTTVLRNCLWFICLRIYFIFSQQSTTPSHHHCLYLTASLVAWYCTVITYIHHSP